MRKGENKKGVEAEEGGDKGKMGALFQWLRGWGDRHAVLKKVLYPRHVCGCGSESACSHDQRDGNS